MSALAHVMAYDRTGKTSIPERTISKILFLMPLGSTRLQRVKTKREFPHLYIESAPSICMGQLSEKLTNCTQWSHKQRVLMHGHQGWNVRHGLCHIYMRYVYIWVVYSLCFFCCLFITVTWWYVWCFEWASGNQNEVQACLVTFWLFIISCYSLYKTTLGLLCSWFENNPHFHKYSMDFHV